MNYHPDYRNQVIQYYDRKDRFSIEGGDILNLSNRVLAVGISQRTTPEAIELLAKRIFADENSEIETILAIDKRKSLYASRYGADTGRSR